LKYDVRKDAEWVSGQGRWVRIDDDGIGRWSRAVDPAVIQPAFKPPVLQPFGAVEEVAQWILLLDCLNFCFWHETADEPRWSVDYLGQTWRRYGALAASLHRSISSDRSWLDVGRWADATSSDVEALFAGGGRIPLFDERVRIIRETGQVTCERFGGQAIGLVESAGFHAGEIAAALADAYPSFHDVVQYRGRAVAILKRAQIFSIDLAHAWQAIGGPAVTHLESLTAFADYRVPQALRHLGILTLDDGLAARIENREVVPAGSEAEVELRACTIAAVERMVRTVGEHHGIEIPAWQMDEYLWERSHDSTVAVEHHFTRTFFY
jgi:hypothetical protein